MYAWSWVFAPLFHPWAQFSPDHMSEAVHVAQKLQPHAYGWITILYQDKKGEITPAHFFLLLWMKQNKATFLGKCFGCNWMEHIKAHYFLVSIFCHLLYLVYTRGLRDIFSLCTLSSIAVSLLASTFPFTDTCFVCFVDVCISSGTGLVVPSAHGLVTLYQGCTANGGQGRQPSPGAVPPAHVLAVCQATFKAGVFSVICVPHADMLLYFLYILMNISCTYVLATFAL